MIHTVKAYRKPSKMFGCEAWQMDTYESGRMIRGTLRGLLDTYRDVDFEAWIADTLDQMSLSRVSGFRVEPSEEGMISGSDMYVFHVSDGQPGVSSMDNTALSSVIDHATGTRHTYRMRWDDQVVSCCGSPLDSHRPPRIWNVDPHGVEVATIWQCGTCGCLYRPVVKIKRVASEDSGRVSL